MTTTTRKVIRIAAWFFLSSAVVLFLLLPLFIGPTPLHEALACLPFGWLKFLERHVSQMTVNWTLIISGILCSALVIVLSNYLLRSLLRQQKRPGAEPRLWPWRWTLALYAGVWLLFVITFGAAGVFRHTTWLAQDPKPWLEERPEAYLLRQADGSVQMLLFTNHHDLASTRKALLAQAAVRDDSKRLLEQFNIILFGDGSNKVAAYVIIPRDRRLPHFSVCTPSTNFPLKPIAQLGATLAELNRAYPENGLPTK